MWRRVNAKLSTVVADLEAEATAVDVQRHREDVIAVLQQHCRESDAALASANEQIEELNRYVLELESTTARATADSAPFSTSNGLALSASATPKPPSIDADRKLLSLEAKISASNEALAAAADDISALKQQLARKDAQLEQMRRNSSGVPSVSLSESADEIAALSADVEELQVALDTAQRALTMTESDSAATISDLSQRLALAETRAHSAETEVELLRPRAAHADSLAQANGVLSTRVSELEELSQRLQAGLQRTSAQLSVAADQQSLPVVDLRVARSVVVELAKQRGKRRKEVLEMASRLLAFSEHDRQTVGLSPADTEDRGLAELWVDFLENESRRA
jgi:DNA repair exonuclease SbcCD ATPase subunit